MQTHLFVGEVPPTLWSELSKLTPAICGKVKAVHAWWSHIANDKYKSRFSVDVDALLGPGIASYPETTIDEVLSLIRLIENEKTENAQNLSDAFAAIRSLTARIEALEGKRGKK